jgi:hypothetical protein
VVAVEEILMVVDLVEQEMVAVDKVLEQVQLLKELQELQTQVVVEVVVQVMHLKLV